MKSFRLSLAAGFIFAAVITPRACDAQSTYFFSNYLVGLDAPVFDAAGSRLSGANYVAVLYGGPASSGLQLGGNFLSLTPMTPVPFTFMPNGLAGYFRGGTVEVNSMSPGGFAWLQVRAWDARLGATFDGVATLGLGGYGESNLFYAPGGNPTGLPTLPEPLTGLQSFSLLPEVPEPNSLLLLLLGLPLFLVRRGRRE